MSKDMKMTCENLSVQEIIKYLVTHHHFPGSNRNTKNQIPPGLGGDKITETLKPKLAKLFQILILK